MVMLVACRQGVKLRATYSDAVRLALDITSIASLKAVELGLLGGGDRSSGGSGRGHGSEGAGNEDGGETHLDGFVGVWKLELVV